MKLLIQAVWQVKRVSPDDLTERDLARLSQRSFYRRRCLLGPRASIWLIRIYRALFAKNKLASTRWALIFGAGKAQATCVAVGFTDILRSAQIWLNQPVPDGDRPLDRALAGGGQAG